LTKDHRLIHLLISALTKNEDLRQDLWVAYLSNTVDFSLINELHRATVCKEIQQKTSDNLQEILNLNIPQQMLDELSDIQISILLMTILGYTQEQVSRYNRVKQAIVDQEMVGLSKHPVWAMYGSKRMQRM